MQGLAEGTTSIRVLGAGSPMTLSLRPVPGPGSRDPLRGREVWHTVTDTTVLAGPRSPAGAVRLLDQLRCPTLTRMRQRLVAATHDVPNEPSAAAAALGTLLQWPYRARTTLVHDIACAVDSVFTSSLMTDRPEVSRTLGWVLALALAYPGDPLVLAPVLLRSRRLPAGTSFVLPAGWPFLRLTGAAVGVSTGPGTAAGTAGTAGTAGCDAGTETSAAPLCARLGNDHGDVSGLVCALERQPTRTGLPYLLTERPGPVAAGGAPGGRGPRGARGTRGARGSRPGNPQVTETVAPSDDALQGALELARQISSRHPQLASSPQTIDLRHRDRGTGPRTGSMPRPASAVPRRSIG